MDEYGSLVAVVVAAEAEAVTLGALLVMPWLRRLVFRATVPVADLRSRSWARERVILLNPVAVQLPSLVPTLAPANWAQKLFIFL